MNRTIAWLGLSFGIVVLAIAALGSISLQNVDPLHRGLIFDALTVAMPFFAAYAGAMIRHFGAEV